MEARDDKRIKSAIELLESNGFVVYDLSENDLSMKIVKAIKTVTGIDINEGARSKRKELVEARFMYYMLMRERTNISLKSMSEKFGQHYSTVIHGLKKAEIYLGNDEFFRKNYSAVEDLLG